MVQNDGDVQSDVMEALREVYDPEIGLNVVELGLIRKLEIGEDEAHIEMILTTPLCPYAPSMMEQTRRKAQDVLQRPTFVELGDEVWKPDMAEPGILDDWGLY
jgi:metal-sulfur cluster biosynthetic enzyme